MNIDRFEEDNCWQLNKGGISIFFNNFTVNSLGYVFLSWDKELICELSEKRSRTFIKLYASITSEG